MIAEFEGIPEDDYVQISRNPPFPTFVKVAWRDYQIDNWKGTEAALAQRYGETRHLPGVIAIDLTHGTRMAAQTLLHEIMHAVAHVWGLSNSKKYEEETWVENVSIGLATVWRDNPQVMMWIATNLQFGT